MPIGPQVSEMAHEPLVAKVANKYHILLNDFKKEIF